MKPAGVKELVDVLGVSKQAVLQRAARESWPFVEQAVRGGRQRLYPLETLPESLRRNIAAARLRPLIDSSSTAQHPAVDLSAGALAPAASSSSSVAVQAADLTDTQRTARDARAAVLAAIRRLQADAGCTQEAAMVTLLTHARAGRLEGPLDNLLRTARDNRGRKADAYPSVRTLKRWLAAHDLAPKRPAADMKVPAWASDFMAEYRKPSKPMVSEAYEAFAARWSGVSIHQVRRFVDKVGEVEKNRGRLLPRELKSLRPFVRRDTSKLLPGDVYTADGHTFDAEIEHPDHGRPFRPEITAILDVATRRMVGWSIGLAESTWAVLDAQRHAFTTCGIPSIFYVDNGGGYANAFQADEMIGMAARIGFEIRHSLPYNSQARGIMERSHQSVWVSAARALPTYMGAAMDREARQKVFKITRAAMKEGGRSELLMAFRDFVAFAEEQAGQYNNRPHSALPRVLDPVTSKRRHQTPLEAWQGAVLEGWQPVMPEAHHVDDMFRPYKVAVVRRGEVQLHNHRYFARALDDLDLHGEQVRVGYDIHDPSQVVIRSLEGVLICTAELDGNKREYFPQSVVEQARDKRAAGRERRLQDKLEEVRAERDAGRVLEHSAGPGLYDPLLEIPAVVIPEVLQSALPARLDEPRSVVPEVVQLPGTQPRPRFGPDDDPDQYRWLVRNPHAWDALDAEWLLEFVSGGLYENLLPRMAYQGVAWTADMEARAREVVRGARDAPIDEGFEVAAG